MRIGNMLQLRLLEVELAIIQRNICAGHSDILLCREGHCYAWHILSFSQVDYYRRSEAVQRRRELFSWHNTRGNVSRERKVRVGCAQALRDSFANRLQSLRVNSGSAALGTGSGSGEQTSRSISW